MKYRIKSDLRKGGIVFDIQQVLEEIHDDVPPGILSFKGSSGEVYERGDVLSVFKHISYEEWAISHIRRSAPIHSIRVGDEVWTVGEKTDWGEILRLEYSLDHGSKWGALTKDKAGQRWIYVDSIKKQPTLESRVKAIEDEVFKKYDGKEADRYMMDEAALWDQPLKFQSPLSKRVKAIEERLDRWVSLVEKALKK